MEKKDILTVRDLAQYAADKFGDKDFCRFVRDGEICTKTYSEFFDNALSVCRYIRNKSTKRMNIAFIGETSYEYIACLTGMIFSGNTVVPFAPDISVEEAIELFDNADIEILFCQEAFAEKARRIQNNYCGLKEVYSLGDWAWFERRYVRYSADSVYAELSEVEVEPDRCALIIYTSGTTGKRKGVMLSQNNLAANSTYDTYALESDDVSFSILPMHHVFCYACDVLKTLYDGGTLCLNGELHNLYKHILMFEPTIMRIVPAICKSILTKIKVAHRQNPGLSKREAAELIVGKNFRRMIAGSAFLSSAIIDELAEFGITARQGYGMSECSPRITTSDFSDKLKYSNGRLTGVDLVRSVDGEIQVKGPSVMLGYYKNPAETKNAFTQDGWLHTGDLGYIEDDHIFLVGRKKNLIILSNGENISPEEIENLFADESIIKEIVVLGENDKLVAEIFPDRDYAAVVGVTDIEGVISAVIDKVNISSQSDRQIFSFRLREKPFERTSTGKIKRSEFYFKGNKN